MTITGWLRISGIRWVRFSGTHKRRKGLAVRRRDHNFALAAYFGALLLRFVVLPSGRFRLTLGPPLSERTLAAPISTVSQVSDKKRRMSLNAGDVMRKTMLIVDASVFVRHALYELFTRQSDFEVCGVAENGREAIEVAGQLHPDLIVLELSMPLTNSLDAARVLKRTLPAVLIIMYGAFEDSVSEKQAKLMGISEIVSKFDPPSLLLEKARALAYRIAA